MRRALWDVVPRDHRQEGPALRRRQLVTAAFVLVGAVVLGFSLRIEPGSAWFYPATLGLAAVWVVGAFASGPLHLGRVLHGDRQRRPVAAPGGGGRRRPGGRAPPGARRRRPGAAPVLLGLLLAAVFVVGALLVREIALLEPLEGLVVDVVDYADQGSLPLLVAVTAVNGVAEELFFRGAAYAAITRHPVAWTTLAYAVATAATGNVMLSFAAVLLGVVVGLERRASGGILGPVLTHCTWSLTMLLVLPVVF